MRVAICLSGLVRTYRETYQNFVDNLLAPNRHHQLDTFISTWPIEHSNNSMEWTRREAWYGVNAIPFPENIIDHKDLHSRYLPITFEVESPLSFTVPWYVPTPGINIQSLMSMIYKVHACDRLRIHYEAFHKFKYDWVIRARFDTVFPLPIVIDNLPADRVTVPSMMQPRIIPDRDWTNDKFAAGNNHDMTVYGNWYNCLESLVQTGSPIQPEILLHDHLARYHVVLNELGCEFDMIRLAGH